MTLESGSIAAFLRALFAEFDQRDVRYCVLHSYDRLPEKLVSDLDMAIHPADLSKLPAVFGSLRDAGYHPLQCIWYSAKSYYFVFGWFAAADFLTVAIDFTAEHREGGVILMRGEDLVSGRRKGDLFWTPAPAVEFRYLLAKKILKGEAGAQATGRLADLVREIGPSAAEQAAGSLVGCGEAARLVEACLSKTLPQEVTAWRRQVIGATWRRDPLNRFRFWVTEAPRLFARMLTPNGLFVAILGPDGVGKSSLIMELLRQAGGCFRKQKVFHWRPNLLWRGTSLQSGGPHDRRPFSTAVSVLHLCAHALDFSLGYLFLVHVMRVRSGLALFDRCFDDILVDRKRYRYGGPQWLPRVLRHFIPKPDILLILDCPEEEVLARKQELGREEMERQRRAYRDLAHGSKCACIIDASGSLRDVAEKAVNVLSDHLTSRFERAHGYWLQRPAQTGSTQLHEAMLWLAGGATPHDSSPGAAGRARTFAVVPSKREPRWIIPLHEDRVSLAAMRMYSPYTTRARVFKNLALLALKLPFSPRLGDIVTLSIEDDSPLEKLVADKLGETQPVFGISFGTSGRHRKLTIQVMNASGEILAYIKIPMTSIGNARVRHEASVLTQLARYPLLEKHVPKLLFAGEWRDRYVLIQGALPGSSGPARLTRAHFVFLNTLWSAQPLCRPGEDIVDEVAQEWNPMAGRLDFRWKQLAQEALAVARRRISGKPVPCGIGHGDFAPWNTRTQGGQLGVFDWECAGWSVPVWWDLFHFATQSSTLLKHSRRIRVPEEDHLAFRIMYMMYLLASTCRILRDEPTCLDGLQYRQNRLAAELLRLDSAQDATAAPCEVGENA